MYCMLCFNLDISSFIRVVCMVWFLRLVSLASNLALVSLLCLSLRANSLFDLIYRGIMNTGQFGVMM